SRHDSNFHDEPISGLQSFRDVQAPPLARPPGCSYRRSAKSSGQPGRLRHAMPVWLPITDCGIATCLNRAIDTTGLSPARLGPFRPLHTRCGLGERTLDTDACGAACNVRRPVTMGTAKRDACHGSLCAAGCDHDGPRVTSIAVPLHCAHTTHGALPSV